MSDKPMTAELTCSLEGGCPQCNGAACLSAALADRDAEIERLTRQQSPFDHNHDPDVCECETCRLWRAEAEIEQLQAQVKLRNLAMGLMEDERDEARLLAERFRDLLDAATRDNTRLPWEERGPNKRKVEE